MSCKPAAASWGTDAASTGLLLLLLLFAPPPLLLLLLLSSSLPAASTSCAPNASIECTIASRMPAVSWCLPTRCSTVTARRAVGSVAGKASICTADGMSKQQQQQQQQQTVGSDHSKLL
jgi:hypothetical protein